MTMYGNLKVIWLLQLSKWPSYYFLDSRLQEKVGNLVENYKSNRVSLLGKMFANIFTVLVFVFQSIFVFSYLYEMYVFLLPRYFLVGCHQFSCAKKLLYLICWSTLYVNFWYNFYSLFLTPFTQCFEYILYSMFWHIRYAKI